jgi:hypothetical protein
MFVTLFVCLPCLLNYILKSAAADLTYVPHGPLVKCSFL